jgi:secreted PhoX family phosphatase
MNEFAGPTFAPNGHTFFVNVQDPGTTFATGARSPVRTVTGSG